MSYDVSIEAVPCGLASVLRERGFTSLTPIQSAVLQEDTEGRDLRLSSVTGSGKTVAIGLAIARQLGEMPQLQAKGSARPRALVVAPTRELAAQLGRELSWLLQPLGARLAVVTGGTGMGGDFRSLSACPHIIVGTPGRLVDHVTRGSIDLGAVEVVALDEADEMLDMGFRDDLEILLDRMPAERITHLVSATFPRPVLHLANRYQRDPLLVQGSGAGAPNSDIEHVGYLIHERDKLPALVNILLAADRRRTLVFARTRIGTSKLAADLVRRGFAAAALSGEMGQRERNTTLEGFRAGSIEILVATDVAARGLDIEDVAQVIHFDVPDNEQGFTHRSGRTARAGNKGVSAVLAAPRARRSVDAMAARMGVRLSWRKVPQPEQVLRAADDRLLAEIVSSDSPAADLRQLAERLLQQGDAADVVAALLVRSHHRGPCAPAVVEQADAAPARKPSAHGRLAKRPAGSFARFHINWGAAAGANPSRLVAMMCRRGDIRSAHIGAIVVSPHSSTIEIASDKADHFARAAGRPDPRNPKVRVRPWRQDGAVSGGRKPAGLRRSA